jgi:hypothetical protein
MCKSLPFRVTFQRIILLLLNSGWGKFTLHNVNVSKHSHVSIYVKRLRWSGDWHAGLWYPSSRVRTWPNPSDFSGRKNPQHAFLRRGSKAVGPLSQICGI